MPASLLRLGVKRLVSKQTSTFLSSQLLVDKTLCFTDLTLKVVLATQKEDSSVALGNHLGIDGHCHGPGLIASINHSLNLLLEVGIVLAEFRIGEALGKVVDGGQRLVELHHTSPQLSLVLCRSLILLHNKNST